MGHQRESTTSTPSTWYLYYGTNKDYSRVDSFNFQREIKLISAQLLHQRREQMSSEQSLVPTPYTGETTVASRMWTQAPWTERGIIT